MTKKELEEKLAALGKISDEKKRDVVCALIGHSDIITMCFGYVNCARCGAQIGDTLGGSSDISGCVVVGRHRRDKRICRSCKKNFKKMDWKDKYLLPKKTETELFESLNLTPTGKEKPCRTKRKSVSSPSPATP
jgi:hypothetical protein